MEDLMGSVERGTYYAAPMLTGRIRKSARRRIKIEFNLEARIRNCSEGAEREGLVGWSSVELTPVIPEQNCPIMPTEHLHYRTGNGKMNKKHECSFLS